MHGHAWLKIAIGIHSEMQVPLFVFNAYANIEGCHFDGNSMRTFFDYFSRFKMVY
jgi:hypothetical protein